MIVEIHGCNFINKGAELMMLATAEWLRNRFPGVRMVVDTSSGPFESRSRHGFYQKFTPARYGRLGWLIEALMHEGYRGRYGLVLEGEIQVVLDASGYALGDPFKNEHMADLAKRFVTWRGQGKTIIMLPQAFGPFERAESREYARRALSCSDVIFARDEESVGHLKTLGVADGRIHRAPDFTVLLKGVEPEGCPVTTDDIILVPNAQMLRQTIAGMDYPSWLAKVAEGVQSRGSRVHLLYHETSRDPAMIAESTAWKTLGVSVIETTDAATLKGILGKAGAVLASRYHAAISSLSQGVPCLGTAWAHKYAALFAEYGVQNWLVQKTALPDEVAAKLLQVKSERTQHARALRDKAIETARRTEEMWRLAELVVVPILVPAKQQGERSRDRSWA